MIGSAHFMNAYAAIMKCFPRQVLHKLNLFELGFNKSVVIQSLRLQRAHLKTQPKFVFSWWQMFCEYQTLHHLLRWSSRIRSHVQTDLSISIRFKMSSWRSVTVTDKKYGLAPPYKKIINEHNSQLVADASQMCRISHIVIRLTILRSFILPLSKSVPLPHLFVPLIRSTKSEVRPPCS